MLARPSIQGGFLTTLTTSWCAVFVEQSSLEPDHCIGLQSKLSQIACAAAPAKNLSQRLALRITPSDHSESAAAQKRNVRAPWDVVQCRAKKRYRLSVAARRRRIAITAPRSHRSPQQTLSRRQQANTSSQHKNPVFERERPTQARENEQPCPTSRENPWELIWARPTPVWVCGRMTG